MSIISRVYSLSLSGLEKLARKDDPAARSGVTEKLLQRIGNGLRPEEAVRVLLKFDPRVVNAAMIEKIYANNNDLTIAGLVVNHPNASRSILLKIISQVGNDDIALTAFRRINLPTIDEIERLTITKLHPSIAALAAQHPGVSRMALINILQQVGMEKPTYNNAFSRIAGALTFSEARYISITAAPEGMPLLLQHDRLTLQMTVELIAIRIKRTKEEVVRYKDGHLIEDCFAYKWEENIREEIELKYGDDDLRQAVELMEITKGRFEFKQLLEAMDKVNPELAAEIKKIGSR